MKLSESKISKLSNELKNNIIKRLGEIIDLHIEMDNIERDYNRLIHNELNIDLKDILSIKNSGKSKIVNKILSYEQKINCLFELIEEDIKILKSLDIKIELL